MGAALLIVSVFILLILKTEKDDVTFVLEVREHLANRNAKVLGAFVLAVLLLMLICILFLANNSNL